MIIFLYIFFMFFHLGRRVVPLRHNLLYFWYSEAILLFLLALSTEILSKTIAGIASYESFLGRTYNDLYLRSNTSIFDCFRVRLFFEFLKNAAHLLFCLLPSRSVLCIICWHFDIINYRICFRFYGLDHSNRGYECLFGW